MFNRLSQIFGIDVGFETLKVAQLTKRIGGGFELWGKIEIPLPPNSVSKNGIANSQEVVQAIKTFLPQAKPHAIKGRYIFAALPESLTYTKTVVVPLKNKREITQAISIQTPDFLPVSAQEVYQDFFITHKNQAGSEVLLVAQPRKLVDSFVEIVEQAGLIILRLETKQLALARLFLSPQTKENVMIIDVGTKVSKFSLFEHGILTATSTVAVGGQTIKYQNQLTPLIDTARQLPEFHVKQTRRPIILNKILVTGAGASIAGLAQALNASLDIPTAKATPHQEIEGFDHTFAVATGLALDSFK